MSFRPIANMLRRIARVNVELAVEERQRTAVPVPASPVPLPAEPSGRDHDASSRSRWGRERNRQATVFRSLHGQGTTGRKWARRSRRRTVWG